MEISTSFLFSIPGRGGEVSSLYFFSNQHSCWATQNYSYYIFSSFNLILYFFLSFFFTFVWILKGRYERGELSLGFFFKKQPNTKAPQMVSHTNKNLRKMHTHKHGRRSSGGRIHHHHRLTTKKKNFGRKRIN